MHILEKEISHAYTYSINIGFSRVADSSKFWLDYADFAKLYALSEVYIDLLRVDINEGFSYRIAEALWLNRKIISNRMNLIQEPFYSPDRIFLIGRDPIEKLRSFLEKDIPPLPNNILRIYDSRLWWSNTDPARLS